MGTYCKGFDKHWLSFHPCNILRDYRRGVSRGNKNVVCGTWKRRFFCTCGSNNWETVEDRWVHAARGLASTELSFHSCNVLRDCNRGVPRGNKNVVKIAIFGLTHWLKHRVTRKLLNTIVHDNRRGVSRGKWVHAARGLASTWLSFHSCNVLRDCRRGVPRANQKMKAWIRKNDDFLQLWFE